jgi:hypothetical protein
MFWKSAQIRAFHGTTIRTFLGKIACLRKNFLHLIGVRCSSGRGALPCGPAGRCSCRPCVQGCPLRSLRPRLRPAVRCGGSTGLPFGAAALPPVSCLCILRPSPPSSRLQGGRRGAQRQECPQRYCRDLCTSTSIGLDKIAQAWYTCTMTRVDIFVQLRADILSDSERTFCPTQNGHFGRSYYTDKIRRVIR